MPTDNYGQHYDVTSRGTNDQVRRRTCASLTCAAACVVDLRAPVLCQGNSYDHRVSDNGNHGYHYSNR